MYPNTDADAPHELFDLESCIPIALASSFVVPNDDFVTISVIPAQLCAVCEFRGAMAKAQGALKALEQLLAGSKEFERVAGAPARETVLQGPPEGSDDWSNVVVEYLIPVSRL